MEPGNYGFFENFCEEEEELHDNSFTRNIEKDKHNNQNQIQGQNQNYNNSIQNMQSNSGVHNIQQNQLIKNVDQNIQNQGINQNISMNQKKNQEIQQLDVNSKQFQVRGEQLKDNIPLMRSVWIYNEEPLPNKKNLNRIFEKNKVLGGLQGFIGCSNDQENDIQQNQQQQQQQNQQKIYQQNDFDQIDCESLFQNNYESENFQIQQLFRQETYFKHQREQELGKQIQQQQQENKENLHKNLRRKDRKNSNSYLPSFVEKISENLEDTIEGIDVSQYSEFSKGEQVLLKQVENFLFIEEKKENQGADYYFEKYFIKNYSRLLEKLKQYSQQSRLTGNQFLKFAFAFGTVLKQVQKQIDEESSSSQIDLSQIYQLPKFEKSNNCSNKSRKTFTNQETQILKFYMQKYNTIPNTIIEQFAKQTGRTSSAVMQKIIRLKKNAEKSKDQNMSQNNNQQQFNSNQQLQCELEFNDGQIQNLNKNNQNQNEGNNSNNQINSSGNLIQNNNQQQQKQTQENSNNNNFENNLVNKIKDQNQQSLEIQLVRVLYNMGNQQGTKQDILNELEVLNNEKKINLPENWNKSASQLLASSKYFEKIKGVFSLSYDPDKGQRLSVSDLQSQKSKLQYIFENYSGNNLDLGQILNFYLDMFCQQQMMEDVSQNFEKKLKLSIQKNLNQYDCFDKSKSKTMYTLADRIKQELQQCDYMGFYTQGQQQQWQTQQQQQQKQIIKIEQTQNQQKDLNQKQNQQYQYVSSYDTNQQPEEQKIQKLEFQNSFFGNNLDIQMGSKMGSMDFQGQNFKEKNSDNQNIQCNQNNNIFRNYHENNYVDNNNTNEKIEQEDDQQQQHFQFLMENDNNQHSQHQVNNFDNNMNNNDQSLDLEEDSQQQINTHSN
ncbi:hypothetical protein PPERSA_05420 [Pseudocohnilembus persalinus]|uniref:Homeodomain protein n=1 Tax=Pseudocohnilembus persalinus TaxID=266149 RepID=A0A0V0R8R7_PSEPJ|nr:hypothetical protein PPERSA_05420 [Pseudocohnilembus persalinus]|eukprot:KRX10600.1 hypothetical protein PPERSA_05420 [Pseudocohnilembus persalinus]